MGYVLGMKGQKKVIAIVMDGWWISDIYSYIYQKTAIIFVEALEDSIVLQLNYENDQVLRTHSTYLANFFRTTVEKCLAATQHRLRGRLLLSTEERSKILLIIILHFYTVYHNSPLLLIGV